jgi:signal transduction histidine kinase
MSEKILCVDDEPNILEAYQRALRREFEIEIALGGEQGLAAVESRGPFAVIVSDMRMPGMDGVQFLSKVKEKAPDSIRIMLTGYADQHTAIEAVNEGNIFRFLTKPCPPEVLAKALGAGIQQYRLAMAEKNLLEWMLSGNIPMMKDLPAERKQAEEERPRLEQQLFQAQKMDAVGKLASGVAHDFNNLLTAINGYAELALFRTSEGDPLRPFFEEIRKAGRRATSLTRQLLVFSRQQVARPKVIDLNAVVSDMDKMLRRLIGEEITLTTLLAPALGHIKADLIQIEQVILNLAVNARDAMASRGNLTIATANVQADFAKAADQTALAPAVSLSVSDTGCGIDPEIQAHIFEPFFTTKEPGEGTGLGLSTVLSIVEQAGGRVDLSSEPGRGATFRIFFPRVDEEVEPYQPPVAGLELPRGTETILLLEDEESVRNLMRDVLKTCGYSVLEAACSAEALAICERHQGAIHLLVTDVVMPQMSGQELAALATRMCGRLKVLYISGYSNHHLACQIALGPEIAFLPKPFTTEALAWKVREALDAPQPSW